MALGSLPRADHKLQTPVFSDLTQTVKFFAGEAATRGGECSALGKRPSLVGSDGIAALDALHRRVIGLEEGSAVTKEMLQQVLASINGLGKQLQSVQTQLASAAAPTNISNRQKGISRNQPPTIQCIRHHGWRPASQ